MADEITFGWKTGDTLTYGAYKPDGTVRTAAATALPEEGATGYYHATDANIATNDLVIVSNATRVVGFGEFEPTIDESQILASHITTDALISTLTTEVQGVENVYDESVPRERLKKRKRRNR